jgi:hypothetical protein
MPWRFKSHVFLSFSVAFFCILLLVLQERGLYCLRIAGNIRMNRCAISVYDIISVWK